MNTKHLLVFSVFAILSVTACGGSVKGGGGDGGSQGQGGSGGAGNTGAGGASSSGSGMSGTGGSASGSGGGIQCTGTSPSFPTFDKACATAADCITKFHMVDCCGSRLAIGMNASESAAFDQAEAICDAMYPGCGCAPMSTKAEDGKTTIDESIIVVDCLSGACSTLIP